jgi:alpha-L-fucosidase 2
MAKRCSKRVKSVKWDAGKITEVKIFSELGGNCRIRTKVPVKVVETASASAKGENPNPFYRLKPVPEMKMNNKSPLLEVPLAKTYIIDFMTEKGKYYTIVKL